LKNFIAKKLIYDRILSINLFEGMEVKIYDYENNKYIMANEYQKEAYTNCRLFDNNTYIFSKDTVELRIERSEYGCFYICENNGIKTIIIAESDIKMQMNDGSRIEWINPNKYQKEAFLYFIKSDIDELFVCSADMKNIDLARDKNNIFILTQRHDTTNVKFTLSRDNDCIKCVRHDTLHSMLNGEFAGYNNVCTYMSADPFYISKNTTKIEEEPKTCEICYDNEQDIILNPCGCGKICLECWNDVKQIKCSTCQQGTAQINCSTCRGTTIQKNCPTCRKPVDSYTKKE
jgi:hypothetical protein